MKIPRIEEKNLLHTLLRPLIDFFHDWIFNQRVYKLNRNNLPNQGPVLVAFTHQCALMDSMAVLSLSNWQPVHISRADIFIPKLQRKFLFFLKMMPIYRVRDGFRNVTQTWDTFKKASEIFRKKKFIIIAPEANHVPKRRVRNLSKGFARMAFKAEEDNDFKLGLRIVPVGLHYEDYYSARVSIVVNVGKPIEFDDLHAVYRKNPQKALLALRDRVSQALKKLIIHIDDLDYYNECEIIRLVGMHLIAQKEGKKIRNELDRFLFSKKVIDKLRDQIKINNPNLFNKLIEKARQYNDLLQQTGFFDFIVRKDTPLWKLILKILWVIIGFPIFLWGLLFNLPIYYIPVWMTSGIKDPSFHTSVRFVHYMLLYPVYYLILFFLSGKILNNVWLQLAFVLSLPITGIFAISFGRGLIKLWHKIRFRFSKNRQKLISLRKKLEDLIKKSLEISADTKKDNSYASVG